MSLAWWWFPSRRFRIEGLDFRVRTSGRTNGLFTRLERGGVTIDEDRTPIFGPGSTRSHSLRTVLPDGREVAVEVGYIGLGLVTGIVVRVDGRVVHESHPGKPVGYPESIRGMAEAKDVGAFAPRNRVPLAVDLATGLLFFAVAKLTDLTTAALVGAAVGIGLVAFQRITRIDVTGGLALFGIVMLLISAGIALVAQDEIWVQLRTTIVGLIAASAFLGDALMFGGRRLAAALARYMPYGDLDLRRLGLGIGGSGALIALLNLVVTYGASKDVWLFYTTFLDLPVTMVLMIGVLQWARNTPAEAPG